MRARLLATTLAAFLLSGCVEPAAVAMEEANQRYAAGDFPGALAGYRALQAEYPDLAQPHVNAGHALYRSGDFAAALAEYERALAVGDAPVRAAAHYSRGNALFRLDRFDQAREAYKDALRIDPSDRDAKFNIEVIDRLRATQGTQPTAQPGQQGPSGGSPAPTGQNPQSGPQPPGQSSTQPAPTNQPPPSGQPGVQNQPGQTGPPSTAPPTLDRALNTFRREVTVEEALRVLEALRRELYGIEGLYYERPQRPPGSPGELY